MDLGSLPKGLIAAGALVVGLVLLLMFSPPKTLCDSQTEIFNTSQAEFLFGIAKKSFHRPAKLDEQLEFCRSNNSSGGCFELFKNMRKLLEQIEGIPAECADEIASTAEVSKAIHSVLRLQMQLAWGNQPPLSIGQRQGWLDDSDVLLFCRLRKQMILREGREAWESLRDQTLHELPNTAVLAGKISPLELSLASVSCGSH